MNGRLAEVVAYEIRVGGRLDESWFDWLDRVSMSFEPEVEGLAQRSYRSETGSNSSWNPDLTGRWVPWVCGCIG